MSTPILSARSAAKRCWLVPTLAVLLVPMSISRARAQSPDIVFSEVMHELMLETPDMDAITTVWWLPTEFWLLEQMDMSAEEQEEVVEVLRPYTMLAVVDGEIGVFGGTTYLPPDQLEGIVSIHDQSGVQYDPVSEDKIGPDAKMLLSMMKPVFGGMLGPTGENMALLLFPAESPEGKRIADPMAEGQFVVQVGERHFEWRTPLGSFLPPKYCPVDGQRLSGAWNYCPWHGEVLELSP